MKNKLLLSLLIVSAFTLIFVSSCKKSDDTSSGGGSTSTPMTTTQAQTHSDDANFYKSESDQSNDDVTNDLGNHGLLAPKGSGGDKMQGGVPCGATVDASQILNKILIYNFDGTTNCWGRTRSGSIKVQLTNGAHWADVGAELTFTYTNYKVTRIFDGKYVTFNGTKKLTDANGINWTTFGNGTSTIKYTERANNIQVAFSSGLTANWNVAHVAEWSYDTTSHIYTFTFKGDTTLNTLNNVSAWGTNRFGQPFTTYYVSPIVCNSTCVFTYRKPQSGKLVHLVNNNTLTLTLGVNSDGSPFAGNGCPWGFNVAWVLSNGNNGNANLAYW